MLLLVLVLLQISSVASLALKPFVLSCSQSARSSVNHFKNSLMTFNSDLIAI